VKEKRPGDSNRLLPERVGLRFRQFRSRTNREGGSGGESGFRGVNPIGNELYANHQEKTAVLSGTGRLPPGGPVLKELPPWGVETGQN